MNEDDLERALMPQRLREALQSVDAQARLAKHQAELIETLRDELTVACMQRDQAQHTALAANVVGAWSWMPGGTHGENDLASMGTNMVVSMTAGTLRSLLAGQSQYFIGAQRWSGISKLVEEAGEVLQIIGKLMAGGEEEAHWDGSNLRVRLAEELADLEAAGHFVRKQNADLLDEVSIQERATRKLVQFIKWHIIERKSRS